jgi:hypothetical protein
MAVSGTNAGHKKHSTWNRFAYVSFGSKADMCGAKGDVRFGSKAVQRKTAQRLAEETSEA